MGMTELTTIKVTGETRDRLKAQARGEELSLGDYLAKLADDAERDRRWAKLRAAVVATPPADLASWREETDAWEHAELTAAERG